jgi:tetratricopeptide (TPR) repeat protein
MSPEQITNRGLDGRSDQFSFGVILAEMLSGRHPFRKDTITETLSAILRDIPEIRGDMPQSLRTIVRRMLAKLPEERFASIAEMKAELTRTIAQRELGAIEQAEPGILLVGRETELNILVRHLENAMTGRGSIVVIGGEPGIGKTHLVTALAEIARLRGALVRTGHCYEAEGSPPYIPHIEILEESLRDGSPANLRYALGDSASEIARIMPELRTIYADIPSPMELPPEQQRRVLFNAYLAFTQRATRLTPLVTLLEDLHWADEPSLLLLEHIAKTASERPHLTLVTYRDVDLADRPFARTLENLLRQKLATKLTLRRLSVEGVDNMLGALSGQKPPPSLARIVFERTEGNPFFVEEVFRHLSEEGQLFDDQQEFLKGLIVNDLRVPESVRLVLGWRLSKLSKNTQRILTTAAVIGRVFSLGLLEELERAAPDAALEALEEAERSGLVEAEGSGRQTHYRFEHDLVRQTLNDALSLPRRQRLHRRIADAMESVFEHDLNSHCSALAYHLFEAGPETETAKAVQYLTEAARRAHVAAAHEEALVHFGKAISLFHDEKSERAGDLHALRGAALLGTGRGVEGVAAYEQAIAVFEQLREYEHIVDICGALVHHFIWTMQLERLNRLSEHIRQMAETAPRFVRCLYFWMKAAVTVTLGRIDESLELLGHASEISDSEPLTHSMALCGAGVERMIRFISGQLGLCEAAARKVESLIDPKSDLWIAADNAYALFFGPLAFGRLPEALEKAHETITVATRVGHNNALGMARMQLAMAYLSMGKLEVAEESCLEAWEFGRSSGVNTSDRRVWPSANCITMNGEPLPSCPLSSGAMILG